MAAATIGWLGGCASMTEGQAVWRTRLELELRRAIKDEYRQRIRQRLAWLDVERRRLRLLLQTQELKRL